jgi:uncharacterized membrane protein YbhN (UPF0104 family)
LRVVLRPNIIVPAVMSAGLIVFLLAFANAPRVFAEIWTAVAADAALIFLLSLVYLIAKGCQWTLFLRRVGIRPAWRNLLMAFAGGELSINVPLGVYLENYLLKGAAQVNVGRSSAATTWMLFMEITCCILALLALDIPGWPWLRPLVLTFLLALLAAGFLFFRTTKVKRLVYRLQRYPRLRSAATVAEQFLDSGRSLFAWQTFAIGLPITTTYLGAQAMALYTIGRALHLATFSLHVAIVAYAFSILVVLALPIVPHLGAVEATGLGVLLTFGISRDSAVAAFLALRVLGSGTVMVITSMVLVLLHQEVSGAIRSLSNMPPLPGSE